MSRQTKAIIHSEAIKHNFSRLQPRSSSKAMAVVKADAYGHGAAFVAQTLSDVCELFAVAICDEIGTLRQAGIGQPVLVLEGPHDKQDCITAKENNGILVAHNVEQLEWLSAMPATQRPVVWLKVDTGMHRLGFSPGDTLVATSRYPWLLNQPCVLMTHFACADDPLSAFTSLQLTAFHQVVRQLNLPTCIANSAATLTRNDCWGDWCRLGIGLYGATPVISESASTLGLQAAMTLQAQIIALHRVNQGQTVGYGQDWTAARDSVIATVGIGYADGYPRHCPTGTPVIVRGQRATLVGRVSMDMITVDVTDIAGIALRDCVELWGAQLPVDEIAAYAGTISYELMTRVSPRVPRHCL